MSVFQRAAHAVIRANQSNLPPPSRGLRTFDYNETLVMFRNRDLYMPTPPSPTSLPLGGAGGGTQQDAFTDADLCTYQNYRGY